MRLLNSAWRLSYSGDGRYSSTTQPELRCQLSRLDLMLVAPFSNVNLSSGEKEDRGNRSCVVASVCAWFCFTRFEAFVVLEECSSQMSLGRKDKPIFAGIIRNSDPIQVNRLFDSHCLLQISEFPKDSLMSGCPDFNPRLQHGACGLGFAGAHGLGAWFVDTCGALKLFVNVARIRSDAF